MTSGPDRPCVRRAVTKPCISAAADRDTAATRRANFTLVRYWTNLPDSSAGTMSADTTGIASWATATSALPDTSPIAASRSAARPDATSTVTTTLRHGTRMRSGPWGASGPSVPAPSTCFWNVRSGLHCSTRADSRTESRRSARLLRFQATGTTSCSRSQTGMRLRATRWIPVCRSYFAVWSTSTSTCWSSTSSVARMWPPW